MKLCINSTNLSQVYILQRTLNVRIVDIFLKIVDNVDIVVNIPTLLFNENAIFMWISLYLREQ